MNEDITARSEDPDRNISARSSYTSCKDMIEYAINNNWDCLRQFEEQLFLGGCT